MKKIALSGGKGEGKFALVDDGYYKKVNKLKWFLHGGRYAIANIGCGKKNKKQILMHHLILAIKGNYVDHVNNNGLDNRRSNLRICSQMENLRNSVKRKHTSSKYKGVSFSKKHNKYEAYITINKKRVNLGLFLNEKHAAIIYNIFARTLFKKFANLNNVLY